MNMRPECPKPHLATGLKHSFGTTVETNFSNVLPADRITDLNCFDVFKLKTHFRQAESVKKWDFIQINHKKPEIIAIR